MLNGKAPLILIQLYKTVSEFSHYVEIPGGVRGVFKDKLVMSGPPIVIYLDEKMTGLYIDTESKRLEIANDTIVDKNDDNTVKIKQRGLNNTVEVNLIGEENSIGLNIFLPLVDIIADKLTRGEYSISYFNKNILIFNSKLASFTTDSSRENSLMKINFSLLKEDKKTDDAQKGIVLKHPGTSAAPVLEEAAAVGV